MEHLAKRRSQGLLRQGFVRGRGPKPKIYDTVGPVELVAEHRCDDLGDASAGCGSSSARAAVVDDRRNPRKETIVVRIAQDETVGRVVDEVEIRPTSRDNNPAAHGTGGAD